MALTKRSISSIDVAALEAELSYLESARVTQVYHQSQGAILFVLHVPRKGKVLLRMFPGKFIQLIEEKGVTAQRPSGFCMQLRKYIGGSILREFRQYESERILTLRFETKDSAYWLIVELYSKGNIILCKEDFTILGALSSFATEKRVIRSKERYEFPQFETCWRTIPQNSFVKLLKEKEEMTISKSLAVVLRIGGVYAKEICLRAQIDPLARVDTLAPKEWATLFTAFEALRLELATPKGYVYEDEISPIALVDPQRKLVRTSQSYACELGKLEILKKDSPYHQKIISVEKIISAQQEQLQRVLEQIVEQTRKGEIIYESYAAIQSLQEQVQILRSSKSWAEIKEELEKLQKISSVDLKRKVVLLEL